MNPNKRLDKFSYITEGPIMQSMIKLALPIMISQLMQTLYNLADTLWVGKVGAEAVAAVSVSFPIVFLMIAVASGLTIAGTALIAQYKGAGRHEQVDKTLGQLFSFVGIIAIVISIVGFTMSPYMIKWMGAEANLVETASGYLRIIFAGIPFMFCFFIFSATLRGIGDTKTAMVMMVISVLMNIVLDPILIFGLGPIKSFGVQGAALATIISRALVTIYALKILIDGSKGIKLSLSNMKIDFEVIKKIVKIGVPSSVEQSMMAIGQIAMTSLVTSFGTMTVASYGIVNRVISLPTILAFGVSASATTMIGQNIGADKKERAKKIAKISITTVFFAMAALGILVSFIPESIVRLFNDEKEVLLLGKEYLRVVSLTFGFIGVMLSVNGIFKGAGKTIPPMVISILSLWLLRVPLGYLLANQFGFEQSGIWWGVAISNVGGALVGLIWLRASDWTKKVIEDKKSSFKVIPEK